MECSCVATGVDEGATTLNDEIRKARKGHKCGECQRKIVPGEKYEYYRGVFEGNIFTEKTCLDCVSVRKTFFCDGYFWGRILEDMRDHVRECFGEISESLVASLTPVARSRICGYIEEYWIDEEEDELTD